MVLWGRDVKEKFTVLAEININRFLYAFKKNQIGGSIL